MTASPGQPSSDSVLSGSGYDKVLAISPGERLQKARKERKLEIGAVAEQLNLSPGVVRALEADDYRMLPNATFVKGYLRSYARVVGISADDLVRGYEALTGADKPAVFVPVAPPMISESRSPLKYGVVALLCAGLLALVMWLVPGARQDVAQAPSAIVTDPAALSGAVVIDQDADASAPEDAGAAARDAESGLPLATPEAAVTTTALDATTESSAAPAAALSQVAADSSSSAMATAGSAATSATAVPAPETALAQMPSGPALTDQPQVAAEPGHGLLKLSFSGDCWVEVRDAAGKKVFSSLKRSGDEVTVSVAPPASVKLGNGDVVAVTFNGQPVVFATTASRKVVRLTLGG